MRRSLLVAPMLAFAALTFSAVQSASAENWSIYKNYSFSKLQLAHDAPFAKQHVVMQISQGDPHRWTLVLNNVTNLTHYFGRDHVQVVVVAYGPGLGMLVDSPKNREFVERVESLSNAGVEFDACHNTMMAFKRKTGHLPKLVPPAVVVPGGIVRIVQLREHGFTYIKP